MSKKRALAGESLGVNLSLIITPMLDMAFQLMAFFIMTFQPLSEEKNISGRLLPPMKEEALKKKDIPRKGDKKLDKDAPPPEKPKDDPKKDKKEDLEPDPNLVEIPKDVVRVIVESKTPNETDPKNISGDPGRILLKFPEDSAPVVFADIGDPFETSLNRMTKKLTEWSNQAQKMAEKSGREGAKLQIEVHPDLLYQYFIQLQDVCRAANFKEMGFAKPHRPKKNN